MSFLSKEFIFFFIFALLINFLVQNLNNKKLSLIVLLICDYIFYSYWDYRFSFLLLAMSLITYYCALNINKKIFYLIGLFVPLASLCYFKYCNFFLETIGHDAINIILPIGISFYTFEAISYIVDVKIEKIEPERDLLIYLNYLSFFPNIISGPIERAGKLIPQLKEVKKVTLNNICVGIQIMAFGFFKKMVIADRLAVFVDDVYKAPNAYNSLTILFAVLTYSIQIYMDFSGYSDIAIGCAKCLGYDLDRNFNLPYISKSVTEFWRRWHITLSTWFKDYVYIPLGGNRKGKLKTYINLLIVLTLSGLWHGANWTYVLWGLISGLLLCIEKAIGLKESSNKLIEALKVIFNYLLLSFTWIFFRADSIENAVQIIKNILSFQKGVSHLYLWSFVYIFILLVIVIVIAYKQRNEKSISGYYPIQDLNTIKGLTLFFIFVGLIIVLAYTNSNPFVYFQF